MLEDRPGCLSFSAHALQFGARVLLEFAKRVEGIGLGVESVIDLIAQRDDAQIPCSPIEHGVFDLVVDLLFQIERFRHSCLGLGDGTRELCGRLLTELCHCKAQFLAAGCDRIVCLHERRAGLSGYLVVGHGRVGVGGVGGLGHGAASAHLRGAPSGAHGARDQPDDRGQHRDAQYDQQRPQHSRAAVALDLIGGEQHSAAPILRREQRLDLLLDVCQLCVTDGAVDPCGDVVVSLGHGDGEQVLVGAKAVAVGCGVGPTGRIRGVRKRIDEHDEQVSVGFLRQLLQAGVRCLELIRRERTSVVGDEPGVKCRGRAGYRRCRRERPRDRRDHQRDEGEPVRRARFRCSRHSGPHGMSLCTPTDTRQRARQIAVRR